MARTTHTTPEPVVLEGYQAIMKPSQYGYSLKAIAPESVIAKLEEERPETLKWAESKLKNPKRSLLKPEPWEEVSQGNYLLKFSWDPNKDPVVVVDSEGTHITDENTPLFGGSRVKLAFYQKPYVLKDGVTYGTRLVLQGVQVISAGSSAGVDAGTASQEDIASLFGKTEGFKIGEPNVITDIPESVLPGDDDF
jgi:hypothetical protein